MQHVFSIMFNNIFLFLPSPFLFCLTLFSLLDDVNFLFAPCCGFSDADDDDDEREKKLSLKQNCSLLWFFFFFYPWTFPPLTKSTRKYMREKTMKTSPGYQDGKRAFDTWHFSWRKVYCFFYVGVENFMLGLMNNNGSCCFVTLCRKLISFIDSLIESVLCTRKGKLLEQLGWWKFLLGFYESKCECKHSKRVEVNASLKYSWFINNHKQHKHENIRPRHFHLNPLAEIINLINKMFLIIVMCLNTCEEN